MSVIHKANRTPETTPSNWPRPAAAQISAWVLLASALTALGLAPLAMPDSYSWVEHGTSESAAQGIDGAWVARTGFIFFGLAVLWLAKLRSTAWGPLATLLHLVFGVSMFAVAAFSTKPWEDGAVYVDSEDLLHGTFASVMGFSFIAGVATLMVLRRNRSIRNALPDWIALAVTITVPLAMDTDIWGVLQRTMFLTAALWYGHEAWQTGHTNGAGRDRGG